MPADPPSPALVARGLACRRGGRIVFSGLDFDLAPGAALILRGPNGSGKTSLLRLLAGLSPPAAGGVSWQSTPLAALGELYRARVHLVGHAAALKRALTVEDNLAFWARFLGGRPRRIAAALEHFGIARLAGVPAGRLSAGQQKRASLARLLLAERPIWLLDEPTVALDAQGTRLLAETLETHLAEGGMAVVATHQPLDLAGETLTLGRNGARMASAAAAGDPAPC